jgi:hypothetical protein
LEQFCDTGQEFSGVGIGDNAGINSYRQIGDFADNYLAILWNGSSQGVADG